MTREEILEGIWQLQAVHPEWTEDESGEDGWDPVVAWWVVKTQRGLVLIDPLVEDWAALDELLETYGGCAGIVRTCHWHQRSIDKAASRYASLVYALPAPPAVEAGRLDVELSDGDERLGLRTIAVERDDELALWLPAQSTLLFADAMVRRSAGELRVCPESWTQPVGGRTRLLEVLSEVGELPAVRDQHVLGR